MKWINCKNHLPDGDQTVFVKFGNYKLVFYFTNGVFSYDEDCENIVGERIIDAGFEWLLED